MGEALPNLRHELAKDIGWQAFPVPDGENVHAAVGLVDVVEDALEMRLIAVYDLPHTRVFLRDDTHPGRDCE